MSNEFYHDERDTRIEAEALQAQEPVVWFAFADNNGPVPLELWGFDERACKHAVLENARSVGWKGTVEGYMLHMGWTIRPLTTAPQPPAPCPKCRQHEIDFALEHDDKLELQSKVAEQSAEIERLRRFEFAFNEWHEKSEWVQENQGGLFDRMLGKHRADCMRSVIDRLRAEVERLEKATQDQCIACKWPSDCKAREDEVERLTEQVRYRAKSHEINCRLIAEKTATIAQQVSEIETWRMRFYEADNHRITAASKVADQEQLKRTIEQQAERIAELEEENINRLETRCQQHAKIMEQDALIEKCEKFAADIPGNGSMLGFVSESARLDVLAAIATQNH